METAYRVPLLEAGLTQTVFLLGSSSSALKLETKHVKTIQNPRLKGEKYIIYWIQRETKWYD
jgi:hypothetical protein